MRISKIPVIVVILLFFCVGMGSKPPADTTPPQVSISAPASNSTVQGTVNILVIATDNKTISKVEFYIDNSLKSTRTAQPYSYSWDTEPVSNGAHAIKATAYDPSNNKNSAQISVSVNNTVSTDTELAITGISASGSHASYPPQKAIDKNAQTYWQGNS